MERRHFLRMSGSSLVGLTLAGWLPGCSDGDDASPEYFGVVGDDTSIPDRTPEESLDQLAERARSLGKPVLVFVVPPEKRSDYAGRRTLFGDFLASAPPEVWGDLALCELACASEAEIRGLCPDVDLQRQPIFVLVEVSERPPRARVIEVEEPKRGSSFQSAGETAHKEQLARRYAAWREELHGAIARDASALRARANLARASLDRELVAHVDSRLQSGQALEARVLADAAALIRVAAEDSPGQCEKFSERLEFITRKRVTELGMSGAGWPPAANPARAFCGSTPTRIANHPWPRSASRCSLICARSSCLRA